MRIKNVKINNYRSINEMEIECTSLITFLGPNNHGKSNVLSAIEFGLSAAAKPVEQDFFIHRDARDNTLWVEITFHELTEQEKTTFKRYVLFSKTVCIRKTAQVINGNIEIRYNGYVEQPNEKWLQADEVSKYKSRESLNQTPLKEMVPSSGRLTNELIVTAQQKYIHENRDKITFKRTLENSPLLGHRNIAGGILPDFYLIPAVRDLTDEMKVKTTTTFGRLLNRAVREMTERDPRFVNARNQIEIVIKSLNDHKISGEKKNQLAVLERSIEDELHTWDVKVDIEITPPEIERLFELGTDIHINDGVKTTADRKGHGLQRAMIFALLRTWSNVLRSDKNTDVETVPRKQSDSVIFAMEEPELFLHPHAQRSLAFSLREIADIAEHQVFLCTHSTHFVNLEHYKEIAIITKQNPEKGSCIRQCKKELFESENIDDRKKRFHMARWINPDRGEIFFAKRVVFVEGETEKTILPYLAGKLDLFDPNISIIDCGSKHNLPLYIAVAKAFNIPYIVIHDEDPIPDPIPDSWNADKIREKKRTFKLNEEIGLLVEPPLGQVEILSHNFENVSGISKRQGEKKGKALAALDHFESVQTPEIPERLKQIVKAVYSIKGV